LLSTVQGEQKSTTLFKPYRSSGDTSASPPENQRNYEQHKEYNEQKFRNARRCCSDAAKSKDRCHKGDNQKYYSPSQHIFPSLQSESFLQIAPRVFAGFLTLDP
jgi:hypothetical protein